MSDSKPVKILAFVGLTGSGKSEAVTYVCEKHVPKLYFGGVIYDEMNKEGIEITPDSQQAFREQWREREGKDVVVKKVIENAKRLIDAGQRRIVLDGLYTWTEYRLLKHEFPGEMTVVAIVAPKPLRYRRLATRPERPFTHQQAEQRDWSEIENLEKGGPIAIADYFVHNDSSVEALRARLDDVLEQIRFFE